MVGLEKKGVDDFRGVFPIWDFLSRKSVVFMMFGEKRGRRLGEGLVRVREQCNGQFVCTIPRRVAGGAKLVGGSVLEFEYFSLEEVRGLSVQERLFNIARSEGLGGVILVSVHENKKG